MVQIADIFIQITDTCIQITDTFIQITDTFIQVTDIFIHILSTNWVQNINKSANKHTSELMVELCKMTYTKGKDCTKI